MNKINSQNFKINMKLIQQLKTQVQQLKKNNIDLENLFSGKIANTITGIGLTENNYALVVSLLKENQIDDKKDFIMLGHVHQDNFNNKIKNV